MKYTAIDFDEIQNHKEYLENCLDRIEASIDALEEQKDDVLKKIKECDELIGEYFEQCNKDLCIEYERGSL